MRIYLYVSSIGAHLNMTAVSLRGNDACFLFIVFIEREGQLLSGRKCKQVTVHLPVYFAVHCSQIR